MDTQQEKKLIEALTKILEALIKKGLMPELSPKQKNDLILGVTKKLSDANISFFPDELQNTETQKSLGLACMAEYTQGKNPAFKFDFTLLFKDKRDMNPEDKAEFQLKLKLEIKNLLKELSKFYNKPSDELDKKLDEMASIMAKNMVNQKENTLADNEHTAVCIYALMRQIDQLAELRRELYGVDTSNTGGLFVPVLAVPAGNQAGGQNMGSNDKENFMGSFDSVSPGAPDPLGIKMGNIVKDIGAGALTGALEEMLIEEHILEPAPGGPSLSPFHTKPEPH